MSTLGYDITVIGGGIVGATLASALSQTGFKVALIEARQPQAVAADDDFALRQSAVAPGPRRLLENAGIWQRIPGKRICSFTGMKVWEDDPDDMLFLEHTELGLPELGHIVENAIIVDAAWQTLEQVDIFCPALLSELRVEEQAAHLELEDGRELTSSLVVGAEGAGSPTRQAVGIATAGWDYGQRCTVGTVTPERHHRHIAWQRFLPSGPVAFLPLSDGRCSLAWHADAQVAGELAELDEEAFCQRLTEATEGVLGRIEHMGQRASFPLRLMHAQEYVRPRVALAGDAAHVVHPMVGQGINLGLMDAVSLVEVLTTARKRRVDPGNLTCLKRYQRARMADNMMMLGAADLCKRAYGSRNPLVNGLRRLALPGASRLTAIRRLMIRQAAGLSAS